MYRIEVPIFINRITVVFYRLRVWDRNEGNFTWATVLKMFQVINFITFATSATINAAITTNLQEAVLLTNFSILNGTHAIRMVYIVWKKTEILQFIDKIGTHVTDDMEESVLIRNKISALLKFAQTFVFACSCDLVLIIICPIFTNHSIINLALPWEKTRLVFWISHLYVSFSTTYCVIWFLITVIIWYLMICCSCQYQLLGNRLRNLGKRDTKATDLRAKQQELFVEDLIKAIKSHKEIHG